ncbi:MAG: FKBP-type peptidyl-prolyl cis-trans isomerase [Bacteroidales bacterium]|jgi:FKBP-type peptidyl-prolyl cis-trans isomerases 1|nr:FKBP-type peptidyl-prolyl cis-trans isomerase [Bacteroidales bacterium]
MKARKFLIVALALSVATVACSQNNTKLPDGTDAKALLPSKAQVDSVSYLLGINFGSFLKSYNFGEDLNYAQMKEGMVDFLKAEGNQNDPEFVNQFKVNPELMNDLFNSFLEKRNDYLMALNLAKENSFLAANAKKDGVQTTDSGLQYKIIEAGNSVKPGPQDTVLVRYKGTLIDGTVFDEVDAESEPIRLTLDRVISGWTEGLQLIGEGGKAQLYIPSELGYGANGSGSIEPNSTLIFDVELVQVFPYIDPKIDPEN